MSFDKEKWIGYIHALQDKICQEIELVDGRSKFREDKWEREGGGGGKTRIIANGAVFEKGGVNTSTVYGTVTEMMEKQLNIKGKYWFACGLSLVLHPENPFVPTVHANWRYFELYDEQRQIIDQWFGGGTDLTPYYLVEEDVKGFHRVLKNALDPYGDELYKKFKENCDAYFVNKHRNNERRGVGGVFFDHLKPYANWNTDSLFSFMQSNGEAFLHSYIPIVELRKKETWEKRHKYWQEIRRGRYTEFNLLHDKGTTFGLKTNGRTESILMSLPPTVRFDYDYEIIKGSEEEKLVQVCLNPKDWV